MADFKKNNSGYKPRGERGGFGGKRSYEERRDMNKGGYGRGGEGYKGSRRSDGPRFDGEHRGPAPRFGGKPGDDRFDRRGPAPRFDRDPRPEHMPSPRFDRDSRPERMPSPRFDRGPRPERMPSPRFDRGPAPRFDGERRPPRVIRPEPEVRFEHAEEEKSTENILAGRNPIREAIINGRPIEKLLVARGLTGSAVEIIARARQAGIVVQEVERKRLDMIYPNHQGMLAFASAGEYVELDELLRIPEERGEEPFFVALDSVTDPHNVGAILRSAAAAGAHGVIVPERRAAGLVPAAVKASAGALEHIAVAKVGNLHAALETLKEKGIWLMAAAADGECVYDTDLTGSVCLVIGSEGDGIGPLVRNTCDRVISLPMENGMESLNASVAAGILLYEIRRARKAD